MRFTNLRTQPPTVEVPLNSALDSLFDDKMSNNLLPQDPIELLFQSCPTHENLVPYYR